MKFAIFSVFAILSALVSAKESVLPPEIIDLLKNLSGVCKEETGISESAIEELKKAKLPDEPKTKCYLKCMMMQLQAMQEDGNLDTELIESSMPEIIKKHGGVETVHKCKHIHEPDLCETAYQLMVCFKKENPELSAMFE